MAPREFLGRLSQIQDQHTVHLREHPGLGLAHLADRAGLLVDLAQLHGVLAQDSRQGPIHHAGILRAGGLGHRLSRQHAVLGDEVHEVLPVPAVRGRVFQQEDHVAILDIAVAILDHVFEERVGLLHLVPELKIDVRELEVVQIKLVQHHRLDRVETGKHPAPSAALLIADAFGLDLVAELLVVGREDFAVLGDVADARAGQRVAHRPRMGVHLEVASNPLDLRRRQRPVLGRRHHRQADSHHQHNPQTHPRISHVKPPETTGDVDLSALKLRWPSRPTRRRPPTPLSSG